MSDCVYAVVQKWAMS